MYHSLFYSYYYKRHNPNGKVNKTLTTRRRMPKNLFKVYEGKITKETWMIIRYIIYLPDAMWYNIQLTCNSLCSDTTPRSTYNYIVGGWWRDLRKANYDVTISVFKMTSSFEMDEIIKTIFVELAMRWCINVIFFWNEKCHLTV